MTEHFDSWESFFGVVGDGKSVTKEGVSRFVNVVSGRRAAPATASVSTSHMDALGLVVQFVESGQVEQAIEIAFSTEWSIAGLYEELSGEQ